MSVKYSSGDERGGNKLTKLGFLGPKAVTLEACQGSQKRFSLSESNASRIHRALVVDIAEQ